ncbi:16S rRNA (uracil(1498)-N(3))-methyltransferase [Teredinibacter sp. KSP-S5-2]|uniref:16S rRNA (uracil(1498)-N(3))-methyltransferase n=1 Tax=Teredinibacter sp. KSP-S5-2 TaxID=3034506 RepID=UPI002934B748|nr:16S rRNA (uracil(1498)-N(3))-methyltransferase [Teredinibacter sp. KSP-S5-2]WNO08921.1 16S rRNA (uracil(1498)-N(3))-methyltransferase [Teredinibacter sp. KSP-S5-2]
MRIPRIYTPQSITPETSFELEAGASHHLLKVLRMSVGRELILFNGQGAEYPAEIIAATKKNATVAVKSEIHRETESPLNTELAIGISKGERMDWVLQKATELGINTIRPLLTERTEVKLTGDRLQKRVDHWQQVVISACEQCQRNRIPEIHDPQRAQDFISTSQSDLKFVLHHRSEKQLTSYSTPKSVSLLIGPEGGLTDEEIAHATQHGFHELTLGPRVLRTETAPIVALAVLQSHWGDF